jgi:hypothetical protein
VEGTTKEQAGAAARSAVERSGEVARTAQSAAGSVAEDARHEAGAVAKEARVQARRLLEESRHGLREAADRRTGEVAGSLRGFADDLRSMASAGSGASGTAGRYVALAGDTLGDVADRLRSGDVESLVGDVQRFARRRPGVFLAAAAGAGFLTARLVRDTAGSDAGDTVGSDGGDTAEGPAMPGGTAEGPAVAGETAEGPAVPGETSVGTGAAPGPYGTTG